MNALQTIGLGISLFTLVVLVSGGIYSFRHLDDQQKLAMATRWISRKWMAFMIVVTLSTGLCVGGFVSGAQWITALTIVTGLFSATNVYQKKHQGLN